MFSFLAMTEVLDYSGITRDIFKGLCEMILFGARENNSEHKHPRKNKGRMQKALLEITDHVVRLTTSAETWDSTMDPNETCGENVLARNRTVITEMNEKGKIRITTADDIRPGVMKKIENVLRAYVVWVRTGNLDMPDHAEWLIPYLKHPVEGSLATAQEKSRHQALMSRTLPDSDEFR